HSAWLMGLSARGAARRPRGARQRSFGGDEIDERDVERVVAGHAESAARTHLEAGHDDARDRDLDPDEWHHALARRKELAGFRPVRLDVARVGDRALVNLPAQPAEADGADHAELHAVAPRHERLELVELE